MIYDSRVGKTASEHGIRCTTIYTDPDAQSQHALSSPYAVNLGDPSAYLDGDRIIEVARKEGCGGIHPGYGFVRARPGPLIAVLYLRLSIAEREFHFRQEVYRRGAHFHRSAVGGYRGDGRQKV